MSGWYDLVESPVGTVFVGGSGEGVHRVDFCPRPDDLDALLGALARDTDGTPPRRDPAAAEAVTRQLAQYFEGTRQTFDLHLVPRGTAFQQAVWGELRAIPHGTTATYGEIAARIGRPGAARAVGMANHHNPIAIVVPCHRVVGRNGALTGYAGGLDRKAWLLDLERCAHQPRLSA